MTEMKPVLTPEKAAELVGCRVRFKTTAGDAWDGTMQKPDGDSICMKLAIPLRPPQGPGDIVPTETGHVFVPYQIILWYISFGRVETGILSLTH